RASCSPRTTSTASPRTASTWGVLLSIGATLPLFRLGGNRRGQARLMAKSWLRGAFAAVGRGGLGPAGAGAAGDRERGERAERKGDLVDLGAPMDHREPPWKTGNACSCRSGTDATCSSPIFGASPESAICEQPR